MGSLTESWVGEWRDVGWMDGLIKGPTDGDGGLESWMDD